jgi:hypothetical protein
MLGVGAAATGAVCPGAGVAAAAVAAAVAAAAGEKRGHHWAKCWTSIEQTTWLRKYNSFSYIRTYLIDFVISTSCILYYIISNKSSAMKIANLQIFFRRHIRNACNTSKFITGKRLMKTCWSSLVKKCPWYVTLFMMLLIIPQKFNKCFPNISNATESLTSIFLHFQYTY